MNEAVSGVITLWRDGIPFWFDIYADPICSILKGKMLLVGLDDVIPDHLYAVVALLSNGNPGMCQIILKEILMASRDDVKTALAAGEYLGPVRDGPGDVPLSWKTPRCTGPRCYGPADAPLHGAEGPKQGDLL